MPSTAKKVQKTHVLIIGGGFAGVSAAAELAKANVDFELLEADSERLGGRVKSFAHRPGRPGSQAYHFEHGAQYIGITQTEILALVDKHLPHALVDGYSARLPWPDQIAVLNGGRYCYDREACLFGIGGIPPQLELWDVLATLLLIQEIEAIQRQINVDEPWMSPPELLALDQVTVEDWFARPWVPPIARDLVVVSVQALFSAEPREISAFYFFWYCACNGGFLNLINDQKGGPQQFYLSTGIEALIEKIAEPFQKHVHLGCPVEWIEQLKDPNGYKVARVTLQDGTVWEADKVIVAMSPSTAGRINYNPPVPPKRQELLSQRMGRTIKCVVFYNEPWWRDSHGKRYTGYSGAASSPVLWVMDDSPPGPGNKGCHALMTFTVGKFVDELGTYPAHEELVRLVTEGLAFLFDDARALSTSKHFIDLVAYAWNPAETFVGGGPNTVFGPGLFTGDNCAAKLLNEPWNDIIYFASAETSRKLNPTSCAPVYTPSPDPGTQGTFPDHRQGLGYMDGAILAGYYVAAQVQGLAPTPASPPPKPASLAAAPTAAMTPPELSLAQVKHALALLCEAFYAGSAIDVAAWEAPPDPWQQDPAALQGWVADVLVLALVQAGLVPPPPDPPTPEWLDAFTQAAIAFVGAGYAASIADPTTYPRADAPEVRSIQALTPIAGALMRLKSTEPFLAAAAPGPPDPGGGEAAPLPGRFTSLFHMLNIS